MDFLEYILQTFDLDIDLDLFVRPFTQHIEHHAGYLEPDMLIFGFEKLIELAKYTGIPKALLILFFPLLELSPRLAHYLLTSADTVFGVALPIGVFRSGWLRILFLRFQGK